MEHSYTLELTLSDLEGIDELKPSFYRDYFKMVKNELLPDHKIKPLPNTPKRVNKLREDKIMHHLHTWYLRLLEERLEFGQNSLEEERAVKEEVPSEIKEEDYHEMQKSLKILEDIVIQN